MRCCIVPVLAVCLSGCATSEPTPVAATQPTTFVVGEGADAGEAAKKVAESEKKTTDVPGSDSMKDAPKLLPLRWFFGGH